MIAEPLSTRHFPRQAQRDLRRRPTVYERYAAPVGVDDDRLIPADEREYGTPARRTRLRDWEDTPE